jgi:hypothetical protein
MSHGAILPGKSAGSPLVQRVTDQGPEKRMPPKGQRLTAQQVELLRSWIDQGAPWPPTADVTTARADHWSLRPLMKPAVPNIKQRQWVHNPIDAFVLARLEGQGMTPSPMADRPTLIRRVSFDLTGLPPTPDEVRAFLEDTSPNAYEKLVDRLLASPAYGERWARHWMDVVHFAETHGHDQDAPRENSWPYRDYLIQSFNQDKPYSRFVEEQIAGDVLYPGDAQAIVATGFLAAGPWDESSQKDIRDDTVDKKVAQNLDRDDMVTTTLSTFLSATVHCARCHDHKFDPITQADYYSLQAVFAGVDRANRTYDIDPKVGRARQALLKQKADLQRTREAQTSTLLAADPQKAVADWEQAQGVNRPVWTILAPISISSAGKATPVKHPDGSIRFEGPRPDVDTYTIQAISDLKGVTAVRLEVLTDNNLPHKGPGRQDNGNLHLSEFRVEAGPQATSEARKPVVLQNPSADFNQAGWTIAMAIDGNPRSAWGIYPEVGKPHQAVFEFKDPIGWDGGAAFTFILEQNHGGGHLIGRLRLAVTTSPRPIGVSTLPDNILRILAIPWEKRSDVDKAELALHVLREKVEKQLASLPPAQMVYAGASDFTPLGSFKPAQGCRPVHLLRRGDIHQPESLVGPGALACVPGLEPRFKLAHPEDEGARRGALAKWITHPGNVLTWRSIVNRVWHYHFARGIAASPNDLGHMGGGAAASGAARLAGGDLS